MNRSRPSISTARLLITAFLIFMLAGCASMPESAQQSEESAKAIRKVIEEQQAAWNHGDIEGFMNGYERSDATVFISGDNVTRGWQTVLDRYKKSYDSRDKMGTLSFTEVEIKPLSQFYSVALGSWRLTRANDAPHGRFTLIFRRTAEGWRIVHDHTSSASG